MDNIKGISVSKGVKFKLNINAEKNYLHWKLSVLLS